MDISDSPKPSVVITEQLPSIADALNVNAVIVGPGEHRIIRFHPWDLRTFTTNMRQVLGNFTIFPIELADPTKDPKLVAFVAEDGATRGLVKNAIGPRVLVALGYKVPDSAMVCDGPICICGVEREEQEDEGNAIGFDIETAHNIAVIPVAIERAFNSLRV